MSASRNARWSYWLRADGLVHRVLALHCSLYFEQNNLRVPADGITECGHLTFVPDVPRPQGIHTGWYVGGDEPPTCILCATGACSVGEALRTAQKELRFASNFKQTKLLNPYTTNNAAMPAEAVRLAMKSATTTRKR